MMAAVGDSQELQKHSNDWHFGWLCATLSKHQNTKKVESWEKVVYHGKFVRYQWNVVVLVLNVEWIILNRLMVV